MKRRAFVLSAAGFLASCGGHPIQSDPNVPLCCSNLGDLNFLNYQAGTVAAISINESSPKYRLSTGISHISVLRLTPESGIPSILETATHSKGVWLPSATIFVPRFVFLDASFNELAGTEPDLYQRDSELSDSGVGRRAYYGACFVPPMTTYVVVHTDASALVTKTVRLLNPGSAGASIALERANEAYRRIDKREYASGNVQHIPGGNAFASFQLRREPIGDIRVVIG